VISVAALTLGANTPSARFRVRQFIPALEGLGIKVTEHHPAGMGANTLARRPAVRALQLAARFGSVALRRLPSAAATWQADVTWISKQIVVGAPSWEWAVRRPLVLDVDDAMWLARPFGAAAARLAARAARVVVVGNRFLAGWYGQHNADVRIIPTSVDTTRFQPPRVRARQPFVIGWTGSRATLPYLETIQEALDGFFDLHRDARLLVICDEKPRFGGRTRHHVDFLPWTPQSELAGLSRLSVGIMPLPDDDLARGKCSFKMLQYMACGIPVVVSPVGSNKEILEQGDIGWSATGTEAWVSALDACQRDPECAEHLGNAGRALVEREYSVVSSAKKLAEVFRSLDAA
jgi:glycosyltransferase involved in cell wall biosynthesis